MKKNNVLWIGVVVIVIAAVGGYLLLHKSSPSYSSSSKSSSTSSKSSAPAVNNAVLKTKTSSSLGEYLTDPAGKALYTYSADTSGVSNCTGTCLVNWPAYVDKGSTSGLPTGVSTLTRSDNSQVQYTYNGLPLYYFAGDSGTQVTGNGVENFSVAKPVAAASSSSSSSSTTPVPASSSSSSSSSSPNYPY